jgi:splicing factor 3B subunit 5
MPRVKVSIINPYTMAADRFNITKSWEHVQNKFVGTGHADMNKFEW